MGRTRNKRTPRRIAIQTVKRPQHGYGVRGAPQSISITGSGGLVLGGTGVTSSSVYGPGASFRGGAPSPRRRVVMG